MRITNIFAIEKPVLIGFLKANLSTKSITYQLWRVKRYLNLKILPPHIRISNLYYWDNLRRCLFVLLQYIYHLNRGAILKIQVI